jgi:alpha-beta hydrolase superfamily lysophospholipase
MKASESTFKDAYGDTIFYRKWLPESKPKALVVISHGMAEHSARYGRFAESLTSAAYAVYAIDHRGHGKTAEYGVLGHYADKDGFTKVVDDLHELFSIASADTACDKKFLFGHSMGSFIAQSFIERFGAELSGCILSGTAGSGGPILGVGRFLAGVGCVFKGPRSKAPLLDTMSFGKFNDAFKPNRTKFDWLSRDNAEVDTYVADPLCGFVCTDGLFRDLLGALMKIHKEREIAKIPVSLPIYMFAGEKDPVGAATGSFKWLFDAYARLGVKDLKMRLYEGARHETLNETNRDEVTRDAIAWLNDRS